MAGAFVVRCAVSSKRPATRGHRPGLDALPGSGVVLLWSLGLRIGISGVEIAPVG
jgi:hypothetical protein